RNGGLTPWGVTRGEETYVWWQCRADPLHEWLARIADRTRLMGQGTGCPRCSPPVSRMQTNLFRSLQAFIPDLIFETITEKPAQCFVPGWRNPFDAAVPPLRLKIEFDGFF